MRLFWRRKYPVKRDGKGRSARQRAFALFAEDYRPTEVTKMLPISTKTACRYFEDYKKQHNRVSYSAIRNWMKGHPEFSHEVIDMLSTSLEMPREEVMSRIQKPWGLLQAMKGRWPNYRLDKIRSVMEQRLLTALWIVNFAERFGKKEPKLVQETLSKIMLEKDQENLADEVNM